MSQPITDSAKAGGALKLGLILAGIVAGGAAFLLGQGMFDPGEASAGHVRIGWGDGGIEPGALLIKATVLASDATVAAFGVPPAPDGSGRSYWRVFMCAAPVDGGKDPGPGFVPGSTIVYDDGAVFPCPADGGARFEAWRQGREDAPFDCACAVNDAGCLMVDGGPAPMGRTLLPGQFTPSEWCLPKACTELAGTSSWPTQECGRE